MSDRSVRITLRDRQVSGGSIPGTALMGEPFVNLFSGILAFSAVTGGDYETSSQTGIFETGSKLYNQKITNRLNVNDNFIISGDTGLISTYNGLSGAGLSGKFLSGTTTGFVVANISDIQGVTTYVQNGTNITTGGTSNLPTINLVASPSVNNITFSGSAIGGSVQAAAGSFASLSATTLSGGTIYSGGTNLQNTFNLINSQLLTKANLSGATFTGAISAPGVSDSTLTSGWAVYAGASGTLKTNSGFTYDDASSKLFAQNIQVGSPSLSGTVTIWGDVNIMGQAISAFTSQLYIEDNNIILNYNPTANTTSTSLGAGLTIQDGSGIAGTDVFFDIRGTATTVDNRSFSTNLNDIRIRETGSISSPNGVRVLAELDILDGGSY